ncbi:MAG TPA: hypothetical protein VN426_11760 [Syntrophomonadaceae bacterium]|nr:hypothetical protein [Syntrophomonadaceae bacterium]
MKRMVDVLTTYDYSASVRFAGDEENPELYQVDLGHLDPITKTWTHLNTFTHDHYRTAFGLALLSCLYRNRFETKREAA